MAVLPSEQQYRRVQLDRVGEVLRLAFSSFLVGSLDAEGVGGGVPDLFGELIMAEPHQTNIGLGGQSLQRRPADPGSKRLREVSS